MSKARAAFERWRDTQVFYREAVLETATFYDDGHGHVIVWHDELGVLKTIALPADPAPSATIHST